MTETVPRPERSPAQKLAFAILIGALLAQAEGFEVTVLDPETAQRLAAEDAASGTNTAGGAAGGAAGGLASALAFVVSALAVLGAVGLAALPLFRDMLPPQIQALLP